MISTYTILSQRPAITYYAKCDSEFAIKAIRLNGVGSKYEIVKSAEIENIVPDISGDSNFPDSKFEELVNGLIKMKEFGLKMWDDTDISRKVTNNIDLMLRYCK